AVYGGRAASKDRMELKHRPAILVGTPGRIADHLRRKSIGTTFIKTLVLDEFDKSLEIGFEGEMSEICALLPEVKKRLLTSATPKVLIPSFVGLKDPKYVNYLEDGVPMLDIKILLSPDRDKLDTLVAVLEQLGDQPGIIFCNFKESINRVSEYLDRHNIANGIFYGGMEQKDRERALIKFRNGSYNIIIATDLAARGLDIPELKYIIHYHLPLKKQEFTHRNGRTARMNSEGSAYILQYEKERLPDFIRAINPPIEDLEDLPSVKKKEAITWETIFVSGGRKDKISKGDIAGLFIKQGGLGNDQVGVIEIKQDCSFVAVDASKVDQLIQKLDNSRLKKKKVRVTRID
ncbi:helicase-related protein, partial [Salibacteraceae bacterium]|nr:helicase-related protein [Salibacteraceae bacterium]